MQAYPSACCGVWRVELYIVVVCGAVVAAVGLRPLLCTCREVSEGVVQKLLLLKQALDQGNLNQASSVQVCGNQAFACGGRALA